MNSMMRPQAGPKSAGAMSANGQSQTFHGVKRAAQVAFEGQSSVSLIITLLPTFAIPPENISEISLSGEYPACLSESPAWPSPLR